MLEMRTTAIKQEEYSLKINVLEESCLDTAINKVFLVQNVAISDALIDKLHREVVQMHGEVEQMHEDIFTGDITNILDQLAHNTTAIEANVESIGALQNQDTLHLEQINALGLSKLDRSEASTLYLGSDAKAVNSAALDGSSKADIINAARSGLATETSVTQVTSQLSELEATVEVKADTATTYSKDEVDTLLEAVEGTVGATPDHEWNGTQLRFEKPNGSWGEYVDLKGEQGIKGDKGDKGDAGEGSSCNNPTILIVSELPETPLKDVLYFVVEGAEQPDPVDYQFAFITENPSGSSNRGFSKDSFGTLIHEAWIPDTQGLWSCYGYSNTFSLMSSPDKVKFNNLDQIQLTLMNDANESVSLVMAWNGSIRYAAESAEAEAAVDFLSTNNGGRIRVYLEEYVPPVPDGTFQFVLGKPSNSNDHGFSNNDYGSLTPNAWGFPEPTSQWKWFICHANSGATTLRAENDGKFNGWEHVTIVMTKPDHSTITFDLPWNAAWLGYHNPSVPELKALMASHMGSEVTFTISEYAPPLPDAWGHIAFTTSSDYVGYELSKYGSIVSGALWNGARTKIVNANATTAYLWGEDGRPLNDFTDKVLVTMTDGSTSSSAIYEFGSSFYTTDDADHVAWIRKQSGKTIAVDCTEVPEYDFILTPELDAPYCGYVNQGAHGSISPNQWQPEGSFYQFWASPQQIRMLRDGWGKWNDADHIEIHLDDLTSQEVITLSTREEAGKFEYVENDTPQCKVMYDFLRKNVGKPVYVKIVKVSSFAINVGRISGEYGFIVGRCGSIVRNPAGWGTLDRFMGSDTTRVWGVTSEVPHPDYPVTMPIVVKGSNGSVVSGVGTWDSYWYELHGDTAKLINDLCDTHEGKQVEVFIGDSIQL